jgi:AraC family transcriptional regulator
MPGDEQRRSTPRFSDSQIKSLTDYISANMAHELSLTELAELLNLTPRQFFRLFSNTYRQTPYRYLMHERVRRAKELLSAGSSPADIANVVGFENQDHFKQMFKRIAGTSPSRFKRENT